LNGKKDFSPGVQSIKMKHNIFDEEPAMPKGTFNFPENFLWGTATAAHQVEGGNFNNDFWAWEQVPGHILNDDKSGAACEWCAGRWREDFDRAQETYQNAHRLSVEWARIQPAPDVWDEMALERYRQMLLGLKERGMIAMVTLHHFTNPLWLAEMGGWENAQVVPLFAEYTRKVVDALGPHCQLWVTINEPNVYMSMAYIQGVFPPGKKDLKLGLQVLANMIRAHAAAYQVIHELQPQGQVGYALHWRGFTAADRNPLTRISAKQLNRLFNEAFSETLETGKLDTPVLKQEIPEVKGTQDFIGLNYYTREYLRFAPSRRDEAYAERFFKPDADLSEHGFLANDPEAFKEAIRWAGQFHKPIYITENGCEDSQDDFRRRYLIEHIHAMWRMVNFNFPIKGYFH
jgi:beta-glucosidase